MTQPLKIKTKHFTATLRELPPRLLVVRCHDLVAYDCSWSYLSGACRPPTHLAGGLARARLPRMIAADMRWTDDEASVRLFLFGTDDESARRETPLVDRLAYLPSFCTNVIGGVRACFGDVDPAYVVDDPVSAFFSTTFDTVVESPNLCESLRCLGFGPPLTIGDALRCYPAHDVGYAPAVLPRELPAREGSAEAAR